MKVCTTGTQGMAREFAVGEGDKDGLTIGENLGTELKEIWDQWRKFSLFGECYLHKDMEVWHHLLAGEAASGGNKGMCRKTRDKTSQDGTWYTWLVYSTL